eukprot:CAMPEP_0176357682 /NCGR_PEP_ID=MMETSP0126-20121128/14969_1 /TAXON_ID=141414 ORGANISM="Strombidinopsis acuminatum, Strain SPMC142" /NCGR_SAMPLE_ID=MMETSP0126 /ASSEMBLY_ACC=CAM_ASM_000229 /LENGTH=36 /DNA_ID= /DNA_START= /DNA_END= /DNA_ORIENTATION=
MQDNKPKQNGYDFFEPIEKAYEWSSAQLLNMIFNDC